MKQYDIVMLKKDIPQEGLVKWQVGTILEVYSKKDFEVEILNKSVITVYLGTLSCENLELIWSNITKAYVGRFKKLLDVLIETRDNINLYNTNLISTPYKNVSECLSVVDELIDDFKKGTIGTIERAILLFAPTGIFQEISIDSGWGDKFIEISNRFDELIN